MKILFVILVLFLFAGCVSNSNKDTTEPTITVEPKAVITDSSYEPLIGPTQDPNIIPVPTATEPSNKPAAELKDFTNSDWLELDEGAQLLSDNEIAWFNTEFFNNEGKRIHNLFLTSLYDKPEDINLSELFHDGANNLYNDISSNEIIAFIKKYGYWYFDLGQIKIPASDMDKVLRECTGLSLAETNKVELPLYYLQEYEAYYNFAQGTNYMKYDMLYGYRESGKVFYFITIISPDGIQIPRLLST